MGSDRGDGHGYNYPGFERRMIAEDMRFGGGPEPGEPAPPIDLPTVTGEGFRLADCRALRPVLLEFGSITCPMSAGARPALLRLWRQFGDQVEFVSVYVREAHPGEGYPEHHSFEQKMLHARDWVERDPRPWTVAVDDLDGSVHRAYRPLPNSLYLIDSSGHVAFRALWAASERLLRRKIAELVAREAKGELPAVLGERSNRLLPLVHGAVEFDATMARAGVGAARDVRREMGWVPYVLQRAASRLRPLVHRTPGAEPNRSRDTAGGVTPGST
jgi:hypothetical protein